MKTMNCFYRFIWIMAAILCATQEMGAQVVVEAKLDSVNILIGEQVGMEVNVTAPKNARIVWPQLKPSQMLVPGLEVVEVAEGDSTELDGGLMKVGKKLTLTAFDEKLYPISGMKVKVDGKAYAANQLALKVITMDVDTLHPNQFFPPKSVQTNPFWWSEWSAFFWMSLLMLALAISLVYLMVRLKQNKPIITKIRIVKRVPPHQRALNAIEKIKAEHLQRSEDQKAYYTQLTDTLRQYINERFGFNAMEMTSTEIIARLQQSGDKTMIDELSGLFQTADLVKFAKYSTLINENDLNLVNAVNFIDQTKLEGQPTEERIVPKLSEEDKQKKETRRAIKVLIVLVTVMVVALLAYVVYGVYQLLN